MDAILSRVNPRVTSAEEEAETQTYEKTRRLSLSCTVSVINQSDLVVRKKFMKPGGIFPGGTPPSFLNPGEPFPC